MLSWIKNISRGRHEPKYIFFYRKKTTYSLLKLFVSLSVHIQTFVGKQNPKYILKYIFFTKAGMFI